ncbi:hypothetical protein HQ545_00390 [Candidatus Woesearchaeota archaeon]|nr:hypothetical protein [Candidatus Woesearchaeota archaeon]
MMAGAIESKPDEAYIDSLGERLGEERVSFEKKIISYTDCRNGIHSAKKLCSMHVGPGFTQMYYQCPDCNATYEGAIVSELESELVKTLREGRKS